jgi:isopentenyl diphosphate isomerase/L-lactate dehydrogenase-like FMN-dependent dehydrogenase
MRKNFDPSVTWSELEWIRSQWQGALIIKGILALGAKGVLLGRAWVYALAAAGEAGVSHMLDLVAAEIRVALSLTGCTRVSDIRDDILVQNSWRSLCDVSPRN